MMMMISPKVNIIAQLEFERSRCPAIYAMGILLRVLNGSYVM